MKLVIEPVERGADVFDFSHAVVVLAVAQARAAKVEAQHGHAESIQRFHRVKDDLVVQRASVFGMRVADQGRVGGIRRAGVQESFELPGRAVQEEGSNRVRGFRHGYKSTTKRGIPDIGRTIGKLLTAKFAKKSARRPQRSPEPKASDKKVFFASFAITLRALRLKAFPGALDM